MTITGHTTVLGVISDPIAHVRAPEVFNPLFEAGGIDAVLVPVQVTPERLVEALAGFKAIGNFRGLAVTIPHKVEIAKLCDRLGDNGRRVGAVNAVRFDEGPDGKRIMIGDMFDGQGYVAGMQQGGFDFKGKRVLQIGAGGAGMAIAFALAEAGAAHLTIANRTPAKAEDLARRIAAEFPEIDARGAPADTDPEGYDVILNATSLGLREDDPMPIDLDRATPGCAISEIIMIPERTKLLIAAEAKGHPIHFGRPMLQQQARLMLEFFGFPAG
jgi:shikimate dehydrogenase